jgi:hypothetical protein
MLNHHELANFIWQIADLLRWFNCVPAPTIQKALVTAAEAVKIPAPKKPQNS